MSHLYKTTRMMQTLLLVKDTIVVTHAIKFSNEDTKDKPSIYHMTSTNYNLTNSPNKL